MFDFTFDEAAVLKQLHFEKSEQQVQQQIIDRIYEALDKRVTLRLQTQMTEQDSEAFLQAHQQGNDQARAWLNQRFPEAHSVYQEELEALVASLGQSADAAVDAVG